MVDPNAVSPQLIEFLAGIATGYLTKKGENILEKSTDRILESLKKKLGKDEFEKIEGMKKAEAKNALEALIKNKHLRKEVHAFYVIYKYLEKFTEDSQFLRVMDFRRGEGIPLDRMYVKLEIIEEQKKKDQLATSKYYDEDYYYQARKKWMRSEEHFEKVNPDEIMGLDKGVICILGLPGAGKTTLCKYFCLKTLRGEYAEKRFPIYIELRGITNDEDPVAFAFHSKLKEHFTGAEIEEAVATIKHNTDIFSPLFIFDGLDEVKVEYGKISESIRNCADSSLCIVTSRRSGFIYLQHDRTYEILPLRRDEKNEFVRNYFTQIEEVGKIEPFLHVLKKREYDSLSKNPLLLSILCALASDIEDVKILPSRRSGLYKKIVGKMNEWHKSKGGEGLSQEEIRVLEDLALSLFLKKRPRILFDERDIDEKILKKAKEVGLIYKWDELRYSFLHLTFQEYFAAYSLGSLKKEWKGIMREKKDVVSWHEILQLFASILSEEEEYEELKELFSIILESPDILHLNYALAGHCLAEVGTAGVDEFDEIFREVSHEFERSLCRSSLTKTLIHLGSKAIDPLVTLLEMTDHVGLKVGILSILGKIGDPKAIDPLLKILEKTDDDRLMANISFALAEIGDPRAVDPLMGILKETDSARLKVGILHSLAIMKDPRAVDLLIGILEKTDDNELKVTISNIISSMKDPRAVDLLIGILEKTDNNELKVVISDIIGSMKDPRAVDPLVDLLEKTDDVETKISTLHALARIGDGVADILMEILGRTNDTIAKMNIIFALSVMGDPRAIDPLMGVLESVDLPLKMTFLSILANLGGKAMNVLDEISIRTDCNSIRGIISHISAEKRDTSSVDLLIQISKETDDELRGKIFRILTSVEGSIADLLIEILEKTDDNELKYKIMFALSKIKDPKILDPLVDFLEKTDDRLLKINILFALSGAGGKAIDRLVNLLEKTDEIWLRLAISLVLAKTGDSRVVDPLIETLEKTDDSELVANISYALAEIGDSRAVSPLMRVLEETNDENLRMNILVALRRFNPIYLYLFMENQVLQPLILNVLCCFSTRFDIRFFEDRIVLPEGDILHVKTEAQRKQAIRRLDRILK